METVTMGRVTTEATIENLEDLWAVKCGMKTADQARSLSIDNALVDTGATLLSMPTHLIQQLGLSKTGSKRITLAFTLPRGAASASSRARVSSASRALSSSSNELRCTRGPDRTVSFQRTRRSWQEPSWEPGSGRARAGSRSR